VTREGRIIAKGYDLFSMETKEMKMETKEEKFHDFLL
jgi:hypothetical protein